MKHEYKRQEKELYAISTKPSLITLPAQRFVMISGKGDPNGEDFGDRVGVLYSLSWAIKMRHKAYCRDHPEEAAAFAYQEYSIYPLEGVWTADTPNPTDKSQFIYTVMIRQPDFITQEMYEAALAQVRQKKPHPLLDEAHFETMVDGLSAQILHKGSFDDEPASFEKMDAFAVAQGYQRANPYHREIYLTDPRKTSPDRRKTILRYQLHRSAT